MALDKKSDRSIKLISQLQEGQRIELKERVSGSLAREMVAFANAEGGIIYCGISDEGKVVGAKSSNRIVSEIQDIARNCEPSIAIQVETLEDDVIAIRVLQGADKPYQCSDGFFMRNGPNSQKMRGDEIRRLLAASRPFFDGTSVDSAPVSKALDKSALNSYAASASIDLRLVPPNEMLINLGAATIPSQREEPKLTNAGVLIFSANPSRYIPEARVIAVRYGGTDRFSIVDRKDFSGDLVSQIEASLEFIKRHTNVSYSIDHSGQRSEIREYPGIAIREAVINALVHRDYCFQNSCVYIHIFSDRLEIENPGGIAAGIALDELDGRSIRRNPVLADLLYRAGYGEKLGSGMIRIQTALRQNGNPPYSISATNFFSIRFLPRVQKDAGLTLSDHQLSILSALRSYSAGLTSQQLAVQLNVSSTTITRAIAELLTNSLVQKRGRGRSTVYVNSGQPPTAP